MERPKHVSPLELLPRQENSSPVIPEAEEQIGKTESEVREPRYDLVIMDFHGTMTDHQLRLIRAYHHAAHDALGVHLGKEIYQEALTRPALSKNQPEKGTGKTTLPGQSNKEFLASKFEGKYDAEALARLVSAYDEYMRNIFIPIPNMPQSIRKLIEEGVEVAMLTNGSNREVIQNQLGEWGFPSLSADLYSYHITGKKKPDVQAVEYILNDYRQKGQDFTTERTLMVGDYFEDVVTARNVGMDSVLVMRGPGWETVELRDPKPTYIITDARDIVRVVHGEFPPIREDQDEVYVPPVLWKREDWNPRNGAAVFERKAS